MRVVAASFCFGYWGLLTALLLAPDPTGMMGLKEAPWFPGGDIGLHFTALATLSIFVHTMRWPNRLAWRLVVLLLVYGLATESLQGLVPARSVQLHDYLANISGVLVGSSIYAAVRRVMQPHTAKPDLAAELARVR
jgi:hypothetical protein